MPRRTKFYEGCFKNKNCTKENDEKEPEEEIDSNITTVKINKNHNIGVNVKEDNNNMKNSIQNLLSNVEIKENKNKKKRNNIVLEI